MGLLGKLLQRIDRQMRDWPDDEPPPFEWADLAPYVAFVLGLAVGALLL